MLVSEPEAVNDRVATEATSVIGMVNVRLFLTNADPVATAPGSDMASRTGSLLFVQSFCGAAALDGEGSCHGLRASYKTPQS
jgi:hypothetical protein